MERSANPVRVFVKLIEPEEDDISHHSGTITADQSAKNRSNGSEEIHQAIKNKTKKLGGDEIRRFAYNPPGNLGFGSYRPPRIIETVLVFPSISQVMTFLEDHNNLLLQWLKNRFGRTIRLKFDDFESTINDIEDVKRVLVALRQLDIS